MPSLLEHARQSGRIMSAGPSEAVARFEFDGRSFAIPEVSGVVVLLQALDLAYRARRGDSAATALLDGLRVRVLDCRGDSYWPPEPKITESAPETS